MLSPFYHIAGCGGTHPWSEQLEAGRTEIQGHPMINSPEQPGLFKTLSCLKEQSKAEQNKMTGFKILSLENFIMSEA